MVIINLSTTWQILRDIIVTHNDTRDTMVLELLGGPPKIPLAANAAAGIAVLIADTLLVRHDDIGGKKTAFSFSVRYGGAMCCGGATRSSWSSSRFYCSEKSVSDSFFVLASISITDCSVLLSAHSDYASDPGEQLSFGKCIWLIPLLLLGCRYHCLCDEFYNLPHCERVQSHARGDIQVSAYNRGTCRVWSHVLGDSAYR
jgi:hypothetical protein